MHDLRPVLDDFTDTSLVAVQRLFKLGSIALAHIDPVDDNVLYLPTLLALVIERVLQFIALILRVDYLLCDRSAITVA